MSWSSPVEGSKALLTLATTTAAVKDTVGTGGVPGHADEETAVVTKVGGPPVLGVGHEGVEVLLEGIVVEGLEGGGIVKVGTEGVAGGVVLAENVELDSIGPPGGVSCGRGEAEGVAWKRHGSMSRNDCDDCDAWDDDA